ncbi:MAG TPA: hypothetical protein DCM87_05565 [Planctomycetes bacterium]|nr:hypothetical protein [Planctomycetota bacterium]
MATTEPTPPEAGDAAAPRAETDAAGGGAQARAHFDLRAGVYHVPATTRVRLVRLHRYRPGMFEVYEFTDETLPQELRDKVALQGGWRDQERQWYDLVEGSGAVRHEVFRRNPERASDFSWDGWERFGSRYIPPRTCTGCGKLFRHTSETRAHCDECGDADCRKIEADLDALQACIGGPERIPKGCWQQLDDLKRRIEAAEKDRTYSRTRLGKLRQKLHPIYRVLIERRRQEQEGYRTLISELEAGIKAVVQRSLASAQPERAVVDELKRLRTRMRILTDQKALGIREFRRFSDELRTASEHEEKKFAEQRKAQDERIRQWEAAERDLTARIEAIEVGIEHSPANWQALLALRDETKARGDAGEIGSQGRRNLSDMVNRLLDQESNLRELGRQEVSERRQVKKDASKTRIQGVKKTINSIRIGLGFTQTLWDELVGIQKDIIRLKNEGAITMQDFKEVLDQVNDKLDTLKKLRVWGKGE